MGFGPPWAYTGLWGDGVADTRKSCGVRAAMPACFTLALSVSRLMSLLHFLLMLLLILILIGVFVIVNNKAGSMTGGCCQILQEAAAVVLQ